MTASIAIIRLLLDNMTVHAALPLLLSRLPYISLAFSLKHTFPSFAKATHTTQSAKSTRLAQETLQGRQTWPHALLPTIRAPDTHVDI
jgi:hypothetical protein